MRSKAFILALILVLPALMAPLAMADTAQYKPRAEVPGDMCYATRVGSFYDSDLFIPIKKTGTDIWTGIVFPEIALAGYTYINQANLTLYFTLDFSGGAGETVTVYGYEDYLEAGTFESSAQLIYGPLTSAHVNIDVSAITSGGFYVFDVTNIVNEILAHQFWTPGASLCFIILGAGETVTRYISSNEWSPAQFPILDLSYSNAPPPPNPEGELLYNRTYKGFDIFDGYLGFRCGVFEDYTNGTEFLVIWDFVFSPFTGEYEANLTKKIALPFNVDVYGGALTTFTIPNTLITIGNPSLMDADIWILSDDEAATELDLYVSHDRGDTWTLRHTFSYSGGGDPEGYTMKYNPTNGVIHIAFRTDGNLSVLYCNFNTVTNATEAPVSLYTTYSVIGDLSLEVDPETDNVFLGLTGGYQTSSYHFIFKQRIGGVWSGAFRMTNDYLVGIVEVDLLWYPGDSMLYACARGADYSGTSEQQIMLYERGPNYNTWGEWLDFILDMSTGNKGSNSASINPATGLIGASYSRGAGTDEKRDISTTLPPFTSYTYFPNSWTSDEFFVGSTYLGPIKSATGWVNKTKEVIFAPQVKYVTHAIYDVGPPDYWGAGNYFYVHDHQIKALTCPSDPFGPYGVFVFLNGTLIDSFDDLDDALGAIDDMGGPPDPEDPSPPGWEEEEIFTRYQVILYLTIAGLAAIIGPVVFMAYKKDLSLIAPVLFLMAVGASLLLYVQYI